MNVFEAIKQRRAVKHYDSNHQISKEDYEAIIEHARQAPTSFNIQNWRLVNVENPETRQKIREAAWDQAQVTDASLLFVICADLMAWNKNPERYWETAPKEVQDFLVPMIKPFYEGKEWLYRDEAMRSVGIVSQNLMLSAKELGYDSCPMIGFDQDKVSEIINLPDDHVVGMMLAIGKATQPAHPKGGFIPISEAVVVNKF